MSDYGNPDYWDDRYQRDEVTFDWLENYQALRSIIHKTFPDRTIKVLVLGCGNAEFSEDMYADGYTDQHNIDISSVVIEQMKTRNSDKTMKWVVMDVMDLAYPDNFFDAAIDKSTADAVFCGDNSFTNIARMTKEVQRVLKPGGVYMVISYGAPENRVFHFQRPHLSFSLEYTHIGDINDPNDVHYVYNLTKNPDADEVSAANFEEIIQTIEAEESSHSHAN